MTFDGTFMLANTFSDTKALWNPIWFGSYKFARYKQFHKHMIILKNVNYCDITYKTDFHFLFFFSFFKITLVLWEWKSGFQQLQWRHSRWLETHSLNFLLASMRGGSEGIWNGKKKKKKGNNTEKTIPWNKTRNLRNQNGLVRRAQNKTRSPGRSSYFWPLVVNSRQSNLTVDLPGLLDAWEL